MLGRNFTSASLIAVVVLAGMAPVSANANARQHATHSTPKLESGKVESVLVTKNRDSQDRTRTAQLNSSQLNAPEAKPSDGTIVSVGPQVRTFQRIRDIAMAPTG
jgi:hypothetical protein